MKSTIRRGATDTLRPIVEYLTQFGAFGSAVFDYLFKKIGQAFQLAHYVTIKQIEILVGIKFKTVSSLIWSGGKVGRNIRYIFIVLFVWTIFLAGGIFQGQLVSKEGSSRDEFLATNDFILAEATAATDTGERSLLDEPISHTVAEGETLDSIGQKYNISIESIKFANTLTSEKLKVGQVLTIPPVDGTIHKVAKGDTIETLSRRYRVPSQIIVDFNYLDAPYTLTEGQLITIPDAQVPQAERFYAGTNSYDSSAYGIIPYAGSGAKGTGQFVWPFSGIITQTFSSYHPGLDIAANSGDIIAADKGTVIRAGWWQGGYGNAVQVDHGNGSVTTYAHMSVISVSTGDEVQQGQKLGVVGSTGRSTGPHLHFTIQKDGHYIDPLKEL